MLAIHTDEGLAMEMLVDRIGVASVVEELARITHEKSNHLKNNWQASPTSPEVKEWDRAGKLLQDMSDKLDKMFLPHSKYGY